MISDLKTVLRSPASASWALIVIIPASLIQITVSYLAFTVNERPLLHTDSALFQHVGWYITQGAVPYVDVWDIMAPLLPETAALLALLAGSDVLALHLLSMVVTGAVSIGSLVLVILLIYEMTGDRWASIAGALFLTALPFFYLGAAGGLASKPFVVFFGLLGLWCAVKERWALAGLLSGLATGFWLLGVIFPVLALGMAGRRTRATVLRVLIGGAVSVVVVLIPIFLWDAFVPMLNQVVFASLGQPRNQMMPLTILLSLILMHGLAMIPAMIWAYGLVREGRALYRPSWWILLGGLYFTLQVFLIDFDSYPDTRPWLFFVALGLGVMISRRPPRVKQAFVWLLLAIAVANLALLGVSKAQTKFASQVQGELSPRVVQGKEIPSIQSIYWQEMVPSTCHYRLSEVEREWLERKSTTWWVNDCESVRDFAWGDIMR